MIDFNLYHFFPFLLKLYIANKLLYTIVPWSQRSPPKKVVLFTLVTYSFHDMFLPQYVLVLFLIEISAEGEVVRVNNEKCTYNTIY